MTSISIINDLSLEKIFMNLPLHDRLKCKEVCQRWYEMLMTRKTFREDRHIYLTNYLLEPNRAPMSVFMEAKYPYDILSISDINRTSNKNLPECEETLRFWSHLGQTITEINLKTIINYNETFEVLDVMPKIEMISVNTSIEEFSTNIAEMCKASKNENFLKQLKKVRVQNIDEVNNHSVKFFKNLFPNVEIFVNVLRTLTNVGFETLVNLLGNLMLKEMTLDVDDTREDEEFIRNLANSEKTSKFLLCLSYDPDCTPSWKTLPDLLEEISTSFRDLSLECSSNVAQFPDPLYALTEIVLYRDHESEQTTEDLPKFLEQIKGLKSLDLVDSDGKCVLGHDEINLPNLTSLTITGEIECSNCLIAISKSFPKLTEFFGFIKVPDYFGILNLMIRNWKHLTVFDITSAANMCPPANFKDFVVNLNESNVYLRRLRLLNYNEYHYRKSDFLKLGQIFPNLATLEISVGQNIEDVIKGIIPACKKLVELSISASYALEIKPPTKSLLDHLEQSRHCLRVLHVPVLSLEDKNIRKQLFNGLDQLWIINGVNRRDFFERMKEEHQEDSNQPNKKIKT